jgi:hypothetical protein
MPKLTARRSLACAAATACASFALTAAPALALNPQPLPPGRAVLGHGFLNPQPLPPIVRETI